MGQTLFEKVWQQHVVRENDDGSVLLYIDRHLIHEVTSPQAFEGLRLAKRQAWRTATALATPDHNIPTMNRQQGIVDPISRRQVEALDQHCDEFGIREFDMNDVRQGIVHVIGPEQGLTLPGITLVCGDSHTSTHGAFAALAMGIGTSDVEHVLATQCLIQKKPKTMRICIDGTAPALTGKDIALYVISHIGTAGGTGYAIEFAGSAVRELSMEGRMTLCNMAIEAGARCGMIAVDDTTLAYVKGRPMAPAGEQWALAKTAWQQLVSDEDAQFDRDITLNANNIAPQVTWGTSPEMVVAIDGHVPLLQEARNTLQAEGWARAMTYMGLDEGTALTDIAVDKVFIGSCTNGRIEDFRAAAAVLKGQHIAPNIRQALAVPGSGLVAKAAKHEGLDVIFKKAGFEWREPGCSMCLAMNADRLNAGDRCASTSNRNFEGRQGAGGRTHLLSPAMAAAAALAGHFVDVRTLTQGDHDAKV
ncbi:MAG: 3-isopropylmalate dehydratase large subunit [Mariprofundaceae bacterium]|nr:3-isopropylmalate dehydratase large subunit [Mariprofundaceae bacterium]